MFTFPRVQLPQNQYREDTFNEVNIDDAEDAE
jgi:hypothetical protein